MFSGFSWTFSVHFVSFVDFWAIFFTSWHVTWKTLVETLVDGCCCCCLVMIIFILLLLLLLLFSYVMIIVIIVIGVVIVVVVD